MEDKSGPSSQSTSKVSKNEIPRVLIIKDLYEPSKPPTHTPKPQRIPKAIPGEPMEQIEIIVGDASKKVFIGNELENPSKQKLTDLLWKYFDIFAWKPEDMPCLDETAAVHKLHIDPKLKTVKQ